MRTFCGRVQLFILPLAHDNVSPLENHLTCGFVIYPWSSKYQDEGSAGGCYGHCALGSETIITKQWNVSMGPGSNSAIHHVTYPLCTQRSVDILQHFCILYEVGDIVSAHRTTGQMNVAGTGGVALLPGMVADGHDTSTRHWCNLSRRRHCPGLIHCIVVYKCSRVYPSQLPVAIDNTTNADAFLKQMDNKKTSVNV
jgi:hypothetical protein